MARRRIAARRSRYRRAAPRATSVRRHPAPPARVTPVRRSRDAADLDATPRPHVQHAHSAVIGHPRTALQREVVDAKSMDLCVERLKAAITFSHARTPAKEIGIDAQQATFRAIDLDRRTLMGPHVPGGAHHHVGPTRKMQDTVDRGGHLDLDDLPPQRLTGDDALGKTDGGASRHACHRPKQVDQLRHVIRAHVVNRAAARLEKKLRIGMPGLHAAGQHGHGPANGTPNAARIERRAARLMGRAEEGVRCAAHA
ncbi:hypothetical protein OKW39_001046 [Paraburkholderia sp. MM6662-R1]